MSEKQIIIPYEEYIELEKIKELYKSSNISASEVFSDVMENAKSINYVGFKDDLLSILRNSKKFTFEKYDNELKISRRRIPHSN